MARSTGLPSSAVQREALAGLRALYDEVDALFGGITCEASTDCCRFGVTGREPYPTAVELALLERAVAARGGLPKPPRLPVVSERRCPLLGADGRCVAYASRPFGCRTFFCERATPPADGVSRRDVQRLARDVAALSERFDPRDPQARPLSRAVAAWRSR